MLPVAIAADPTAPEEICPLVMADALIDALPMRAFCHTEAVDDQIIDWPVTGEVMLTSWISSSSEPFLMRT